MVDLRRHHEYSRIIKLVRTILEKEIEYNTATSNNNIQAKVVLVCAVFNKHPKQGEHARYPLSSIPMLQVLYVA